MSHWCDDSRYNVLITDNLSFKTFVSWNPQDEFPLYDLCNSETKDNIKQLMTLMIIRHNNSPIYGIIKYIHGEVNDQI